MTFTLNEVGNYQRILYEAFALGFFERPLLFTFFENFIDKLN